MAMNDTRFAIVEGDEVFGSDGEKVGNIVAIQNNYVVVEKGWFFPTDYYIPMSAITSYEDGKAYLNVTKDLALNQGWDVQPTYTEETVATTATGIDTGYTTDATLAADRDLDAAATAGWETDRAAASDATLAEGEVLEVPVYEEELVATKRAREVGGARIEKDVVEEDRVLEVPVTEERLKVVRRTVDRPVDAAVEADAFEEVIVDVPIEVEEVEVGKRTRVAEEIAVQKQQVQRTEQVHGKVRHEEVTVTEATDDAVINDRVNDRGINP